jgi:UDP-N-acetylmuramate--alanine ligase
LRDARAHLSATHIEPRQEGIAFEVFERESGAREAIELRVPGRHNVQNALAAIAAARACGVSLKEASTALRNFAGLRRRFETVGSTGGITIIDDFAHNPDKIAATLATLHDFAGRLLVMFQPHGFGPLRLMKDALIDCFAANLREDDALLMPEPVYFGGTTDRSVSSIDIVKGVAARGRAAYVYPDRAVLGRRLVELAKPGDRILVMGARDDTLAQFAAELLKQLGGH